MRHNRIFVATLGASHYSYAEVTWTQRLRDWIDAHVRAFAYFGRASELLVPDNANVGVKSPSNCAPDVNPTYHDLAAHYGIAVMPTRVRTPRDEAKVENGVQDAERQILPPLRKMQFFSPADLDQQIRRLFEVQTSIPSRNCPARGAPTLRSSNDRRFGRSRYSRMSSPSGAAGPWGATINYR